MPDEMEVEEERAYTTDSEGEPVEPGADASEEDDDGETTEE